MLSLKGQRKRCAVGPHLRRKLAGLGWAGAFLSAAAAAGAGLSGCGPLAPSCSGRSSPSRSLPFQRLPRSPCLSLALIFSCCRYRGARTSAGCARWSAPAPLASYPGAPRPDPDSQSCVARSLRLGRWAPRRPEQSLSRLPSWLAPSRWSSYRTPRAWWRLQPGGRQLFPAASRTPGGSARGSVRSVSTARRGPGSGHRKNQPPADASSRPRGGRARHRPLGAAQTSPALGELWPAGTGQRGPCPPAFRARAAAGTPGLREVASDELPRSGLPEEDQRTGVLGAGGSSLGAGPAF